MINLIFKKPISSKEKLSSCINNSNFKLKNIDPSFVFFDNIVYDNEIIAKKEIKKKINDNFLVYFCLFQYSNNLKTLVYINKSLVNHEEKKSFNVVDLEKYSKNKNESESFSIDDLLENIKI